MKTDEFTLLPPPAPRMLQQWRRAVLESVEETTTLKGVPMIRFRYRIMGTQQRQWDWCVMTPQAEWRWKHLWYAFRDRRKPEPKCIEPNLKLVRSWVGRKVWLYLTWDHQWQRWATKKVVHIKERKQP